MPPLATVKMAPQGWNLIEMTRRQCRNANCIDIMRDGQILDLIRTLKQRAGRHLKSQIGKGRGNHLLATVMPILTEFGDQDPGGLPVAATKDSTLSLRSRYP